MEHLVHQVFWEEIAAEEGRLNKVSRLMADLAILQNVKAAGQPSLRESSDARVKPPKMELGEEVKHSCDQRVVVTQMDVRTHLGHDLTKALEIGGEGDGVSDLAPGFNFVLDKVKRQIGKGLLQLPGGYVFREGSWLKTAQDAIPSGGYFGFPWDKNCHSFRFPKGGKRLFRLDGLHYCVQCLC